MLTEIRRCLCLLIVGLLPSLAGAQPSLNVNWQRFTADNATWPDFVGWNSMPADPTTGKMLLFAGQKFPNQATIYASNLWWLDTTATTNSTLFTWMGGNAGNPVNCTGSSTFPSDRHPGNMVVDTRRNRLYQIGGVNDMGACVSYSMNNYWYWPLTAIPTPPIAATQTVTSTTLPINIVSAAQAVVYDHNDDVIFYYGGYASANSSNLWVYCDTQPDSTIRARQIAAGCATSGDWQAVTNTKGTGGVYCQTDNTKCPLSVYFVNFVWDQDDLRVLMFGGDNGAGSVNFNATWEYDPAQRTWTNRNPSNP